jgi:hypothetical protein
VKTIANSQNSSCRSEFEMKTILAQLILLIVATGGGQAQQVTPEKHVKDIRAEQTQAVISANPLCRQVRAAGHSEDHKPVVDSSTLEPNLSSLMQNSDEVVLGGAYTASVDAFSPSGANVVQYFDVRVLRSWKGSHKVGDLLTFGVPWGGVSCRLPGERSSSIGFFTLSGGSDWQGIASGGPWILFLRYSRGNGAKTIYGLRLTGGDGLQGLFQVDRPKPGDDCYADDAGGGQQCSTALDSSLEPISVRYRLDPLKKQYDKIPVSVFLKEVQSVADALGGSKTSGSPK